MSIYIIGLIGAVLVLIYYFYFRYRRRARQMIAAAQCYLPHYCVRNQSSKPVDLQYIFLGDSIFLGVGTKSFEGTLPYVIAREGDEPVVEVSNLARSGACVCDLPLQLASLPAKKMRAVAFVCIGINDVTHGTGPDEFMHELTDAVKQLLDYGASVVLATIPNCSYVPALGPLGKLLNYRAVMFNRIITDLVSIDERIVLANLHHEKIIGKEHYARDSFHLDNLGYSRLVPYFVNALKAFNTRPE